MPDAGVRHGLRRPDVYQWHPAALLTLDVTADWRSARAEGVAVFDDKMMYSRDRENRGRNSLQTTITNTPHRIWSA